MKSALRIVAFANNDAPTGIVALLEIALEALDTAKQHIPAALVSSAIHAYTRSLARESREDHAASNLIH